MPASKTDALLQDIARLFVVYPASVWKPVLQELQAGGPKQTELLRLVVVLIDQAESSRASKAVRSSKRNVKPASRRQPSKPAREAPGSSTTLFPEQRSEVLNEIGIALAERRVLKTPAEMREVYLKIGGKGDLPKSRKVASLMFLQQLSEASDTVFASTLRSLNEGTADDTDKDVYARWFRLIRQTPSS